MKRATPPFTDWLEPTLAKVLDQPEKLPIEKSSEKTGTAPTQGCLMTKTDSEKRSSAKETSFRLIFTPQNQKKTLM
jgi:hypothetical protein